MSSPATPLFPAAPSPDQKEIRAGRRFGGAVAAVAVAVGLSRCWPEFELGVLARGAAGLAAALTGSSVAPMSEGWALPGLTPPLVVTRACSGADHHLLVTALLAWRAAGRPWPWVAAVLLAVPVTWAVNALRIAALAPVYRWVVPRLPEAYVAFLHLLIGVAVFLPALIALNLILERHARRRASAPV